MQTWSVDEAQARFGELLDACTAHGPQQISRDGAKTAVLVPISAWRRAKAASGPSLKALLLAGDARSDDLVPRR
jgi:antitoxin Phd